ncbi:hypothetical protein [Aurantiacibacter sp. D1-12]|uniref:hypothetical protein n=1 Tax=Aurantiacibacter sp. D1-12 TaxID=2993658 RepID=UPI00237C7270|nr:hypothetical protein [Aurantiacibacter sp. D1-12]MDE1466386.1 hypothetical protein [Aurantiacibacter sp. D1-12]
MNPQVVPTAEAPGATAGPSISRTQDGVPSSDAPETQGEGWGYWPAMLGALLAALLGSFVWFRRRQREDAETLVERPQVIQAEPSKAPEMPNSSTGSLSPTSQDKVADTTIGSLVSAGSVNPATLVSTGQPRNRQMLGHGEPTPQTPPSSAPTGMVTTNLAAKRRAEAEAIEKARREVQERQKQSQVRINRSINFDWG